MKTREEVMEDVLMLLGRVSEDWEYSGEITAETRFSADMGLASLDVVMLGTAIQEHYGKVFPFMKLFAELGERQIQDIPVGEWINFIHKQMQGTESPENEVASAART